MKNRSKETHHYVPQTYLRHWCALDGKMWIRFVDGQKPPFRATPYNFANEKGMYDTSTIPELSSIDQEGDMGEIEGNFASMWPEVFDHIGDPAIKLTISRYIALMHLRHPDQREAMHNVKAGWREVYEQIKDSKEFEFVGRDGKVTVFQTSKLLAMADDSPGSIKSSFLKEMRRSLEHLAQALFKRKWGVIFEEDKKPVFVTSDCPVVLERGGSSRRIFGFGTPGTVVTFPISPTKLLRISEDFAEDGLHYPLKRLGDLNLPTTSAASRFIFSASKPETL